VQLLDVKFGALPHPTPQNRAPLLMHFQHVTFGFFTRITKYPLENHGYVGHQIHRIIVNDNQPWRIETLFRVCLLGRPGMLNRFRAGVSSHLLHQEPSLPTHQRKANIGRVQFNERLTQAQPESSPASSPFPGRRLRCDHRIRGDEADHG